ncbi:hypothetical protein PAEPH01_2912, partial [Pancytospora epiphaga]
ICSCSFEFACARMALMALLYASVVRASGLDRADCALSRLESISSLTCQKASIAASFQGISLVKRSDSLLRRAVNSIVISAYCGMNFLEQLQIPRNKWSSLM